MFVGPDHPIFGDRGRGGQGRWGGDGFLPPMGAPPGARFDPVAPGVVPFGPGFGGRGGRGRGGPPGAGNLHDPDNDEFMPPGAVSVATLDLRGPIMLIRCLDMVGRYVHVRAS